LLRNIWNFYFAVWNAPQLHGVSVALFIFGRTFVKKSAALLLLIGLVHAAAASGQESDLTPTAAPLSGMTSTLTPTVLPMHRVRSSLLPASGPMAGVESVPVASSSPSQASVPMISSQDGYVALNFTNVDISALVKVMSELTRRNFILDERVTGKVTIMTPVKVTPEEAYQMFLSALEIKGFTAVEDGKVTRIIPTATARQSGLKVLQDNSMRGEGFVTRLLRMNFVNPQEIVRAITPLLSKDGNLIAYPATNSIILTDSVSNIRRMESLIHALDVAAPEGKGKINVYYLKNANAEDIAKLMQALVSKLPAAVQAGGAAQAQPQAQPQLAGPAAILEGAVTITADKATNSLIIVGSPGDYETVKDVIQKLDIRRRQVYVEAAIIEMSLTKTFEISFEFQQLGNLNNNATSALGGTNFGNIGTLIANGPTGLSSLNGLVFAAVKGVFTYNGVQYLNVLSLITALQTNGDVNVLSTPNLLTMDNQKAEIMVGSNIPFITGQTQNPTTGSSAIMTSVDRKDVGVTLKLTPQITSDDNVRLDIYEEVTAIIDSPGGLNVNTVGPSISKRSASTTVVVKDRQTMVIGGLISNNVTSSTSEVPLLGEIPVLGWLFKTKSTSVDKTNLMIFITPYIVKNEVDAGELTIRKSDAQEKFRQEYRMEKKSMEFELPKPASVSPQPSSGSGPAENKVDETLKENQVKKTVRTAPTNTIEKTGDANALKSSPTNTTGGKNAGSVMKTNPTNTTLTAPGEGVR
jgi:general secretion pathway protein D